MVIDIEKIIVKDRIRKDFGNIQELSEDIQQNGLINPPVVNKEYELLAGERRLRACKALGWNQIEVRMMDTRDAEHELNVEISENENRKEFSKAERVDYMKRLLRIEQAKAKERQGERYDIVETFPQSSKGKARDKAAEQFGISGKTMEKEMSIVENKDLLTPEDFADWDEGKLSTNKAFQKIKSEQEKLRAENKELEDYITHLEESKKETSETLCAEISSRDEKINELLTELNNIEPVTVIPPDYNDLKKKAKQAEAYKADYHRQQEKTGEKQREILELQNQIKELQLQTIREQTHNDLIGGVLYFIAQCGSFIQSVGGYVWIADKLAQIPEKDREGYVRATNAVYSWASVLLENIRKDKVYGEPELQRLIDESSEAGADGE